MGIQISPPSRSPSLFLPHPIPSTGFGLPASCIKLPLAIYLTYGNVCFKATLSIHPILSFLHSVASLFFKDIPIFHHAIWFIEIHRKITDQVSKNTCTRI